MLCRGQTVSLFTLNGEVILEQAVSHEADGLITACAFYEGLGNEYLERDLIFTGHKRGIVNVCAMAEQYSKALQLIVRSGLELLRERRQIRA